jgi:hypothetical protein
MGTLSMKLGPAVAFLMSALNLRLGLWLPHPLNPHRNQYFFPGWYFFLEMFGHTKCEPIPRNVTKTLEQNNFDHSKLKPMERASLFMSDVHLSDGGHFENLALYELIRRRCRYIIVSDCGADPDVAFDDLANALRRIREDFGVEIELDVSPLRPDSDGKSKQHAVIGTVHYNGLAGYDKGTILYIKPTLTGDEPPDVLQYRTRNTAFPHESTGDQFYDEAQWESYRRLGEHAGHSVLRFLEKPDSEKSVSFVENAFMLAGQYWHPAPEQQNETFLSLTARCAELESDVRDNAPAWLRAEFFPEVTAAFPRTPTNSATTTTASSEEANKPRAAEDDETRGLYFLLLVIQVMEDAWLGADLENYWSHPLNEGWMNYFQRWASTPSFRRWWPILRPVYSPRFRDFVKERFDVRIKDPVARPGKIAGPAAVLTLHLVQSGKPIPTGLALTQWERRFSAPNVTGKRIFEYKLALDDSGTEASLEPMQVGFLLYTEKPNAEGKKSVQWDSKEMFIPHSLMGAGIIARFLDAVRRHFLDNSQYHEIIVTLEAPDKSEAGKNYENPEKQPTKFRPDPAARRERVQTINFYKSRGFTYYRCKEEEGEVRRLRLDLDEDRARDKKATS